MFKRQKIHVFGSHFVFIVYAKTVMFTTCYTAEMDSAPKNHRETTVLFLKNAYCILSMAIYLFWDSTTLFHTLSRAASMKPLK